jgi:hypothetical protein
MEHHFNVEEAELYGIECAILIYNIRFWVNKNKANGKHFYKGCYWTYNSSRAFSELFPYLSKTQISRHLRSLEAIGVLKSDNFNSVSYDKTKWYAINPTTELKDSSSDLNDRSSELNKDSSNLNNRANRIEQAIPDNKTDNKTTDNKQHIFRSNFKNWELSDFENEIKLYKISVNLDQNDLLAFYNYWRELTPSGKMRFQLEKTWQTELRLGIWERNKNNFGNNKTKDKTNKDQMLDAAANLMIKYKNEF